MSYMCYMRNKIVHLFKKIINKGKQILGNICKEIPLGTGRLKEY